MDHVVEGQLYIHAELMNLLKAVCADSLIETADRILLFERSVKGTLHLKNELICRKFKISEKDYTMVDEILYTDCDADTDDDCELSEHESDLDFICDDDDSDDDYITQEEESSSESEEEEEKRSRKKRC